MGGEGGVMARGSEREENGETRNWDDGDWKEW